MCYSGIIERQLNKLKLVYDADPDIEAWDLFHMRQEKDPKTFSYPHRTSHHDYAPIIHMVQGRLSVEPMRFGIHTPRPAKFDYNARSDNLQSFFWQDAYKVNHGFIVLRHFFENVGVADLIKDGRVSLADVQSVFDAKKQKRYEKYVANGKKYKPTATELKPIIERSIEIEFSPVQMDVDLLVPIIFTTTELFDGETDRGFAMVTDPATKDIEAAGHDRRPIVLGLEGVLQWMNFKKKSDAQLQEILGSAPDIPLQYRLSL